jgi:UDP-N-acetylglucosamine diphosphorylase/glucosamine-1-phosphate N-acetyltransferase
MGELRMGILTIREKWERLLKGSISYITQEYLQEKFPIQIEDDNYIINSSILPNKQLCDRIKELGAHEALLLDGELVAARLDETHFELLIEDKEVRELQGLDIDPEIPIVKISRLWNLIQGNGQAIADDFKLITGGRASRRLPDSNRIIGTADQVFLEDGAKIEACTLNTTLGPIYIGKDAEVMEGCMLRGPLAIGSQTLVKMGSKIYGATTLGPGCRVGGEVSRSIMIANSNKSHEGYLGDSVLGEWCNMGADSNNSNLKNNYSEVKLWDYASEKFEKTGLQFCGLMMGDHAKCGINTMFNTGTVAGVFANIFGAGYPRNFIPDFSWGGPDSPYRTYKFADACDTAAAVMARRDVVFTELDKAILYHIYDRTAQFRSWEK